MLSLLCFSADDVDGTIASGTRALELAEQSGDTTAAIQALNNVGAIEFMRGDARGLEKLDRGLELARQSGLVDEMASAYCWGAGAARRSRSYRLAAGIWKRDSSTAPATTSRLAPVPDRGALPSMSSSRGGRRQPAGPRSASSATQDSAMRRSGRSRCSGDCARRGAIPGQSQLLDQALELAEASHVAHAAGAGRVRQVRGGVARRAERGHRRRNRGGIGARSASWRSFVRSRARAVATAQGGRRRMPPGLAKPYALALSSDCQRGSGALERARFPLRGRARRRGG